MTDPSNHPMFDPRPRPLPPLPEQDGWEPPNKAAAWVLAHAGPILCALGAVALWAVVIAVAVAVLG